MQTYARSCKARTRRANAAHHARPIAHTHTHTHTHKHTHTHTCMHACMHTYTHHARPGSCGSEHTRRAQDRHAHETCLARVQRPVVLGQARNACLSERHARQRRVVQLRRAEIKPRVLVHRKTIRGAAHIEIPAQQNITAQTQARSAQMHKFQNPQARAN